MVRSLPMVTWEIFPDTGDPAVWDGWFAGALGASVFQSHGWGQYKRASGWVPLRYVACDPRGRVVAQAQCLRKPLPFGLNFLWVPGGLSLATGLDPEASVTGFLESLVDTCAARFPRALFRLDSHVPNSASLAYRHNQVLRRPYVRLNSGYTLHHDLSAEIPMPLSTKHRYYVRKAQQAGLRFECGSDDTQLATFAGIHGRMTAAKSLTAPAATAPDLARLRDALGVSHLTVLTGYLGDHAVTACLTLDFNGQSIYYLAATNEVGRQASAAYAMVPALFSELTAKGVRHFNFGGIDPATPSTAGVNHFKRGFGGLLVENLGEWEWAPREPLRMLLNAAIRLRGGRP